MSRQQCSASSRGRRPDLEFSIISRLFYNLAYAKRRGICDDRNELRGPHKNALAILHPFNDAAIGAISSL